MPRHLKIVFMGTPEFAATVLDGLLAAGHSVLAAYTQPPRPARRGHRLQPSPVQALAEARGVPVRAPVTLRDPETQAEFAALGADAAVVAAYGLILPAAVLTAPRLGCINVHASLLPRWRGAAPIQRAILAGDEVTGVTIMQVEEGLDSGPMLLKRETSVDRKTGGELTEELARLGAEALVEWLSKPTPPIPQPDEGVTYAKKIDKAEARIDWSRSAAEIERQVRAFAPSPGAWFEANGERVKVVAAEVETVIPAQAGIPLLLDEDD